MRTRVSSGQETVLSAEASLYNQIPDSMWQCMSVILNLKACKKKRTNWISFERKKNLQGQLLLHDFAGTNLLFRSTMPMFSLASVKSAILVNMVQLLSFLWNTYKSRFVHISIIYLDLESEKRRFTYLYLVWSEMKSKYYLIT